LIVRVQVSSMLFRNYTWKSVMEKPWQPRGRQGVICFRMQTRSVLRPIV
jgi:hypothetical protein